LQIALARNEEVALGDPKQQPEWLPEAAKNLIDKLTKFAHEFEAPKRYLMAVEIANKRVNDVGLTIGSQLASKIEDQSLATYGLKLANDHYAKWLNEQRPLVAIDKEYSKTAQSIIKAAIIMGIHVQAVQAVVRRNDRHH